LLAWVSTILLLDQIQGPLAHPCSDTIVTGLPAPFTDQALGSLLLIFLPQPFDLPNTQSKQNGCFFLDQSFSFQTLHHF
jgi:hypothetical protein